jgi:hypothetical protein
MTTRKETNDASRHLLPGPDAMLADPTFEEWLDASIRAREQVSLV